ncbi:MAG: hypothetical protein MHM6MM_001193 [Cercozoa sp. M6MM]
MSLGRRAMSIASQIEEKLTRALNPLYLDVINESHMHSVPRNSETHFKVVVVSEQFDSMSVIERHRAVQEALCAELQGGVHALAIRAKTPAQWEKLQARGEQVAPSPDCLGGMKREAQQQPQ